jgi:hypothetical protein
MQYIPHDQAYDGPSQEFVFPLGFCRLFPPFGFDHCLSMAIFVCDCHGYWQAYSRPGERFEIWQRRALQNYRYRVTLEQMYQTKAKALGLIGQNSEHSRAADGLLRTFGKKAEARRPARVGLGTSRTSRGAAVRARREI